MTLRRNLVRSLTNVVEFSALRKLYACWMAWTNYLKYGDPEFPRMISIEINSHCNRACSYCPNAVAPQTARLIKEDVFKYIVHRIAEIDYSGVIDFIFFSEPTLHPKLEEYIRYVKSQVPKCIPRICTNGDLLTTAKVRALENAGLDRIYVMRHVPTPEGWVNRIRTLDEEFPGLFVRMDIEELEKTQGLNHYGGVVQVKKVMGGERNLDGSPSCRVHTHVAQITIDGDWNLCCTDFGKTFQFGSLLERSIMEIWNDHKFVAMRSSLRSGNPVLEVCKTCFVFSKK